MVFFVLLSSESYASEPALGTKENPIKCYMPSGEQEYIMRLRCPDGDEPEFERLGSYGKGPNGNILDGYKLRCRKDNIEKSIFMDMYHRGYRETNPILGLTVLMELPALIATGCPPQVPGFEQGTYIFRMLEVRVRPQPKFDIKAPVKIGIKGRAYVELIIDKNGHVDMDKIKILYISDEAIREHAIRYLSGILFEPAEHHPNCKVPVKVELGFDFE